MRGPGDFQLLQQANAICGEGPVWDWRDGLLYWIDLDRPAAYCFDPVRGEQVGNWPVDSRLGMLALTRDGRLLIATSGKGIGLLDPATGSVEPLVHPGAMRGPGIYNDGRVDPGGRLWSGWITEARVDPGMIFRVEADGAARDGIDGIYASNGMGWSPDGRTMYFTDSTRGLVFAADFDAESGTLGERRVFLELPRDKGIPDGMAVDTTGHVWIALYLGWHIIRCDPNGKIVEEIRAPVLNPTSLCFGGPHLDVLYITSAVRKHPAAELSNQPWAGALMALRPGVAGLPEPLFG
jgi:sugar lactone lactonase YvrE